MNRKRLDTTALEGTSKLKSAKRRNKIVELVVINASAKNIFKSTGCYGNLLEQNNFFHCISYPCLLMSHFLTEKCEQQQQSPKNVPQVRDVVKLYVFVC